MPPKNFTGAEIIRAIRPLPDVWAGRDGDGRWSMYEVDKGCLDEQRAAACRLASVCDEKHAETLRTMEALGLIACIPVSTPQNVFKLTKRM